MTTPSSDRGCTVTTHDRLVHLRWDGTRANALGADRYDVLVETLRDLDEGDVLLVTAAGRHFSAGQDLEEWNHGLSAGATGQILRRGTDAVLALLETPATVVVGVNGAAVGGGALVAAAGDLVVLADDARLRVPELELGMPLGASVLARLVGDPAARRLSLTGAWCPAQEVALHGGVEVVESASVLERATELARRCLDQDPVARAAARTLFGDGERGRVAALYRAEVEATLRLFG